MCSEVCNLFPLWETAFEDVLKKSDDFEVELGDRFGEARTVSDEVS